ncbi:hypothetical protein DL96DRAFT_1013916 [Flagelloscypha sp. PMI_526]|nr:hypothetical protein DL96DRAFT_1013916 [Flagelloscypha sp. PMI_526]
MISHILLFVLFSLCAFGASVSPRAAAGYGFVYFIGEDYLNGEQIYFAVSNGNSPATWTAVKGGAPVLNSTLGDLGVRDPFIIKSTTSSTWYIIATDLKMYGKNGDWDTASRHGSLSLAVWETTDFKTFSAERLVKVSPDTAGMSWAPEATWSPSLNKFVVYWASKLYASTDTNHTGTSYSRILYSTTSDFKTFSAAQVWIDPGTDIIDTTVAYDATTSTYHRFSKTSGLILQQKSTTGLFGTWTEVTRNIGSSQIGSSEGPLVFLDNTVANKWHLFLDDLSPRGYVPFESTNITAGSWALSSGYTLPANPRHGTVFPVTAEEAANLRAL